MDYAGHQTELPVMRHAARPKPSAAPFLGSTSYQNQFLNWGIVDRPVANKQMCRIRSMPFKGRTAYEELFKPIDLSSRQTQIVTPYVLFICGKK